MTIGRGPDSPGLDTNGRIRAGRLVGLGLPADRYRPGSAVRSQGRIRVTCCCGGAGSSSPLRNKPGLYCRHGVRLGWLRADRAEQQIIDDLALPEEVDLP